MRTLEPVDFMSIPWRVETEPTGYLVENCTGEQCLIAAYALVSMLLIMSFIGMWNDGPDYYFAFDVDCNQVILNYKNLLLSIKFLEKAKFLSGY